MYSDISGIKNQAGLMKLYWKVGKRKSRKRK
jgi:hypothetical protein